MQLRKIATEMIEWSFECIKDNLADIKNSRPDKFFNKGKNKE